MILSNGEYLLAWPLSKHVITAGMYYKSGKWHGAIDMRTAWDGDGHKDCGAAMSGVVEEVQYWDGVSTKGMQSYGNMVKIRHTDYRGQKLYTRYAHLSKIYVKEGDEVNEGDIIGVTGATGNVSGAHLHFEVILGSTRCNPLNWLDNDFTKADKAVKLGNYTSVVRVDDKPANPGESGDLDITQEVTIIKATFRDELDSYSFIQKCEELGIPVTFTVQTGGCSSGDAATLRNIALNCDAEVHLE